MFVAPPHGFEVAQLTTLPGLQRRPNMHIATDTHLGHGRFRCAGQRSADALRRLLRVVHKPRRQRGRRLEAGRAALPAGARVGLALAGCSRGSNENRDKVLDRLAASSPAWASRAAQARVRGSERELEVF